MRRQKREERLEIIRNNAQLKYAMKRKVSNFCSETELNTSTRAQVVNFSGCVTRAVKTMRHSSCSKSAKRSRQRQMEIRRTPSLLLRNMRAMMSRRSEAGEDRR